MASKKVSTLNALTSAGDDDLLYIADTSDSGASYASKRITVQNFLNGTASATALTTEEGARAAADAALSGRLDTLEADPTTATALSAEIAARTSGDSALSGRLNTLEADPTTATAVTNAIAVETAARQAADALLLPLAGGTMTGAIELGASSGGPTASFAGTTATSVTVYFGADTSVAAALSSDITLKYEYSLDGVSFTGLEDGASAGPMGPVVRYLRVTNNELSVGTTFDMPRPFVLTMVEGSPGTWTSTDGTSGSFGATASSSSTIGVDGTATFGGNVTASAVPSDNAHLVNKLYADNLVAGVDLSGIATNAAAISAETTARTNADTALSGRLDTLEADPTTQTLLDAETTARTSALTAETNARTSADTALSGRLDTLEADPTTQALLDAETAARIAGDALKLDLAGGLMTGSLELGVAASTTSTAVFNTTFNNNWTYSNNNLTATNSGDSAKTTRIDTALPSSGKVYVELTRAGLATFGLQQGYHIPPLGEIKSLIDTDGSYGPGYAYEIGTGNVKRYQGVTHAIPELAALDANDSTARVYGLAIDIDANKAYMSINGSTFYELTNWFTNLHPEKDATSGGNGWFVGVNGTGDFTLTLSAADWTYQPPSSDYQMIGGGAGGGSVSTIAVDGTATFGGNVTASAVPSDDTHLVNKLYADNLVAGVDLSGIATNASAIAALTNGAPELLNTLNELAAAIGDDENFATTVTNQISSESTARTNADNALSGRLDTLEADPTTGTALTTETNARTTADTALSNRLDTLEADPTTQTLLDAETTARQAADALLLPLAGGTMSGAINFGQGAGAAPTITQINPDHNLSTINDLTVIFPASYGDGWATITADAAKEVASGGKYYFEFLIGGGTTWNSQTARAMCGITGTETDAEMYLGNPDYEYFNKGSINGNNKASAIFSEGSPSFVNGDVLGVGVDLDASTVYFTINGAAATNLAIDGTATHVRPAVSMQKTEL
ncbi:MAG: hypothetical protein CBD74_12640, partial [Saprospirales bacterium TMED214]